MKKFVLLLAAIVALASCSHDEVDNYVAPMPVDDGIELIVTASMDESQTRIASDDGLTFSFVENEAIGLYITNPFYQHALQNVKFNAGTADENGIFPFTKDSGEEWNTDNLFKQEGTSILAYAPYSATDVKVEGSTEEGSEGASPLSTAVSGTSRIFSLAAAQSGDVTEVDNHYVLAAVPTAPKQIDASTYKVDLRFSGIYSLVKFRLVNTTEESVSISKVRLAGADGVALTGLFSADLSHENPKLANTEYKLTAVEGKTNNYVEIVPATAIELAAGENVILYAVVNAASVAEPVMTVESMGADSRMYSYTKTFTGKTAEFTRATRIGLSMDLTAENRTLMSSGDIIAINSVEDLQALAAGVNDGTIATEGKTVVLAKSLDMAGETWTPIGNKSANAFKGTFEGGNFTISNLESSGDIVAGLFGFVAGGTIQNLTLSGATVTGGYTAYAGGIACSVNGGKIYNCTVTGSTISKQVSGVGAIAYVLDGNATVDKCTVSETTLSGSENVGGIISKSEGSNATNAITNCELGENVVINVSSTKGSSEIVVAESFNSGNWYGVKSSTGNQLTLSGNKGNATININFLNGVKYTDNGTTAEYTISSKKGLEWLATTVNHVDNETQPYTFAGENIRLTASIDLCNADWTPIGGTFVRSYTTSKGTATEHTKFLGTFDGGKDQGLTISNLKVEQTEDYAGLFGLTGTSENGSVLKNIAIVNADVKGHRGVGAVAGAAFTGKVENCSVSGTVKVEGNWQVGGISGHGYATIHNCSVEGDGNSYVKGTYIADETGEGDAVGGIVGFTAEKSDAAGEVIKSCTAKIDVEGSRKVGGIAGQAGRYANVIGCTYEGDVRTNATTTTTTDGKNYAEKNNSKIFVSGIVGEVAGGEPLAITIKDNTVKAATTVTGYMPNTTAAVCAGARNPATITETNNTVETGVQVIANPVEGVVYNGITGKCDVSSDAGLAWALKNNVSEIDLAAGEYTLPNSFGSSTQTYTINGVAANAKSTATAPTEAPATRISLGEITHSLNGASMTFNNIHLVCSGTAEKHAVYCMQHSGTMTFNQCYIEENYWCYSNTTFNYCYFKMGKNAAENKQVDYCLYNYGANVDVVGCTFDCAGRAIHCYNEGGDWYTLNVSNSTFKATEAYKGYPAIIVDSSLRPCKVNVSNCNVNDVFPENAATGSNICGVKTNSTLGVNCIITIDGKEIIAYGVKRDIQTNEYELTGAKGMQWFANAVNVDGKSFSGETVILTENVDLAGIDWEPIGQTFNKATFCGVFDGKGKTISNLSTTYNAGDSTDDYHYSAGLFGWVEGHSTQPVTIKNVTISGAVIDAVHYIGTVAGHVSDSVLIDNCKVLGTDITGKFVDLGTEWDYADKIGGVVGYVESGATISNCYAENATISGYRHIGGVIGYLNFNCTATGCSVGNGVVINVNTEHNYKGWTTQDKFGINPVVGLNNGTISDINGTATINFPEGIN